MTEPPRGSRRASLALAAAVAALACLPYLQTARFGPTYDDHAHVLDNVFVHHPENARFLLSWRYLHLEIPDQGRPVFVASLLLDRALFGDAFGGYHLQSVVWHAIAALLVLALARSLGLTRWTSSAAGALFALHPACTEAVASVSNREDPLATVFALVALLTARRFLRGGAGWLAPTAIAFALALGSKESALAAPLLLGALALASPRWRPASPRRWVPLGAVGALVGGLFVAFQLRLGAPSLLVGAGGGPLAPAGGGGPLAPWLWVGEGLRVATVGGGVDAWAALPIEALRVARVLLGWPLSAEHDPSPLVGPLPAALGALALAGLAGLFAVAHRRAPRVALGLSWLAAATVPTLASPWLLNPIADRFLYLPAVGVCVALAAALAPRRAARAPRLVLLALLAVFAARTADRVPVWRDDAALFADAVRHAPRSARAWQNLGAAELEAGRLDEARRALRRAIALDARLLAARVNLGRVELRAGDVDAAVEALEAAVRTPVVAGERDLHDRAFRLLARVLSRAGRRARLRAVVAEELARRPASRLARAWAARLGSLERPE